VALVASAMSPVGGATVNAGSWPRAVVRGRHASEERVDRCPLSLGWRGEQQPKIHQTFSPTG
jgi:hypothetical protein